MTSVVLCLSQSNWLLQLEVMEISLAGTETIGLEEKGLVWGWDPSHLMGTSAAKIISQFLSTTHRCV